MCSTRWNRKKIKSSFSSFTNIARIEFPFVIFRFQLLTIKACVGLSDHISDKIYLIDICGNYERISTKFSEIYEIYETN